MRKVLAVGLFFMVGGVGLASSSKLLACETCHTTLGFYGHCTAVADGETGYTECYTVISLDGTSCLFAGDFCSSITVSGGGGGGETGGGGGGSTCQGGSFCPAECFSCGSGSGGRPAN